VHTVLSSLFIDIQATHTHFFSQFEEPDDKLEEALAIYQSKLLSPGPSKKEEESKGDVDTSMTEEDKRSARQRDGSFLATIPAGSLSFLASLGTHLEVLFSEQKGQVAASFNTLHPLI